jgi:L-iditol 2-dehydrogenase
MAAVSRLHGAGDIRVAEEPVPAAGAGESLVRVEAVGICGSDLHWFEEGGIGDARLADPLVIGHEFAGVVEGGPLDGRRVAVDPALHCGHCERCLEGHQNLCANVAFAGHGSCDGGLREYLAWPTEALHPLPDSMDGIAGAMLEPLGVAIHALDLGHVHLGADVAVVGCGPIGLLVIAVARAAGARVVLAVDPLPHRRAAAERAGAESVVAPEDVPAGIAADVTFEVAGNDGAVEVAMQAARAGARVVLIGIPSDHRHGPPDERRLPARDSARRAGPRRRRLAHLPPLPAGPGRRGVRDRRRSHRVEGDGRAVSGRMGQRSTGMRANGR